MADETRDELPLVEVKGTGGLKFRGYEESGEDKAESATNSQDEGTEEVLTVEQTKERYPNLKIKVLVAGEQKTLSTEELAKHYQLYGGRERTIEQRNLESARYADELRELRAELVETKKGAAVASAELSDPDDPGVFVDTRVGKAIESKVNPKIEALDKKIDQLLGLAEPMLEDAQTKKAKSLLKAKGIDDSAFDEFRQARLEQAEGNLGRQLTPKEIATIPADTWAVGYAMEIAAGKLKVGKSEKQNEYEPKTRLTVKTIGSGGGSGGGGSRHDQRAQDQSLRDVIDGKVKMADHLRLKKGIRPYGSEEE